METVLFATTENSVDLIVSFVTPGEEYFNGDFGDMLQFSMMDGQIVPKCHVDSQVMYK